jgi:hypothetical protein
MGYTYADSSREHRIYIYPVCDIPTFFLRDASGLLVQIPDTPFSSTVNHLPEDIRNLYDEARGCMAINAYTASVLASRKLLMNIAVAKGAAEGLRFIEYVDYFVDQHFVPPNSREWVDHIRKKGNEATHEIALMGREDAEELLTFLEMLLKFIFEFPNRLQDK